MTPAGQRSNRKRTLALLRRVYYFLTDPQRNPLHFPPFFEQKVRYFFVDLIDSITGRREKLLPPKSLGFVGKGDFKEIGQEFLQYFVQLGGLRQTDRVLDVGCGIGRMAVPLTQFISADSHYEGFDIVPDGIEWCTRNITHSYPNFTFQLADVFNKRYHPKGSCRAAEYKFPYEDNSFDFVFLTSVFTHMVPGDMENYLSEIKRVMRPGARCLITFFLLNEESLRMVELGRSACDFNRYYENYGIEDEAMPEKLVGFKEEYIRRLFRSHELEIIEPVHSGSWCGRPEFLSFQDIVVARKL
jgi:SAM-dependent methyltransferase